jgi:hypothetical protein
MTRTSSAAAPLLLAATTALAEPVVFRNGDGAWFEWEQRTADTCSGLAGEWLDVTLPPSQGGQRTDNAIQRAYYCGVFGCEPETTYFEGQTNIAPTLILTAVEPWMTDCCMQDTQPHLPVIGFADLVQPADRWERLARRSFYCEADNFFVGTSFVGVRLPAPNGASRFGWVLIERRRPELPDDSPDLSFPTAWAFETEPDTALHTPPCRADLDFNFQVDFFDYLQFVQDFDAGHWITNFEYDDQLDFFDYLAFLEIYASCSE